MGGCICFSGSYGVVCIASGGCASDTWGCGVIGDGIGKGAGGIAGTFEWDDDTCIGDDDLLQSFDLASSFCFAASFTCVLELD